MIPCVQAATMKGKKDPKQSQKKKKHSSSQGKASSTGRLKYYGALAAIVVISMLVYLPVLHNGLLAWDDQYYILDNPLIYNIHLGDIFSKNVMGNYHPLTVLTLAIEYKIFGLDATGYHAVNLLIHLLNVILVFYAILLLNDKPGIALVASLLFGIHPLHVESVAWASELKDLLYTFFFLASYICYQKSIKDLNRKYYAFAIILFLASLLSKAMAASLPLVLLLTDYLKGRKFETKVLLEKAPFFLLAIIFGIVAIAFQKSPEFVQEVTSFSFLQRIAFACYGFITYLYKFFVPINLSAYYPYPLKTGNAIPIIYYGYIIILAALVAGSIYSLRFTKKIVFGLGFFAVTVFLVLQLLPIGDAIMADRYSYIPTIGLCYLAGEGMGYAWTKSYKWIAVVILSVFVVFFSITTYKRSQVWKDDWTLWDDAIQKYQTIPLAYYNRGLAYMNAGQLDLALNDYNKAIELKPKYTEAYVNRGNILRDNGRQDEALNDYNKAIEINPIFSIAYFNRGILFMNQNRVNEALSDYNKTIEIRPTYYKAYSNRGVLFVNEKRYEEAIRDYSSAIDLQPDYSIAYYNRAMAKYYAGKKEEGCLDMQKAASQGYLKAQEAIPQLCN